MSKITTYYEKYNNMNGTLNIRQYEKYNKNYEINFTLTINNINIGFVHFIISNLNSDHFIKTVYLSCLQIDDNYQGKGYGTFLLKRCLMYIYDYNKNNTTNHYFIKNITLEDATEPSYGGKIYLQEGIMYNEFIIEHKDGKIRPLDGKMSLDIYNKDNLFGTRKTYRQIENNFINNFNTRYKK